VRRAAGAAKISGDSPPEETSDYSREWSCNNGPVPEQIKLSYYNDKHEVFRCWEAPQADSPSFLPPPQPASPGCLRAIL